MKEKVKVNVGVIGFGTVGSGVVDVLLKNVDIIEKRTGVSFNLTGIADLDIETSRGLDVPKKLLTTDAFQVIEKADIITELVGGTTVAKKFIIAALEKGKHVVTANKALLAEHGKEIFSIAEKYRTDIYYGASVAGGIPIIKALREGLVGNRIKKILGILNGTCNYILTHMEKENTNFELVLKDAQQLGYAEADPTLDIEGYDTAHKSLILASLAYGEWFDMDSLYIEGIKNISLLDLKFSAELGYKIKLLGVIKEHNGKVEIRVHPTLIPTNTLLADVNDVFNGVMVTGEPVGDTLFYGRGAGRDATASAVIADIVDIGLNLKYRSNRRIVPSRSNPEYKKLLSMNEITSRYYLRLQVVDKPGVTASVSSILGEKKISISSILQKEGQSPENVTMLILTHLSKEQSIKEAVKLIERLDCVKDAVTIFRIEDI